MRDAIRQWPSEDFVSAVRNLPPGSATVRAEMGDRFDWGHLAANVAYLVDLMSYTVHTDYQQAITDPDDPEVKAEREYRKKNKIKPPPVPLVPPVAFRPDSVASEYDSAYRDLVARHRPPAPDQIGVPVPGGRWVTNTAELDLVLDAL